MVCKYRVILSIDGGGLLGVIPLKILDYLHRSLSECDNSLDVTSWVDVFSSTSTSSIFTGALMLKDENQRSKYKPSDLLHFYERKGSQMFNQNIGIDSGNSTFPLAFVLEHFFGKVKMGSFKNHFLFVSYNKTHKETCTFSNSSDRYRDLSLSKVMRACSAAENVFPPLFLDKNELIDAKFCYQNPALMAYDYARMFYQDEPIILVSIGTGGFKSENLSLNHKQSIEVDNQLTEIAKFDRKLIYFRYQPELDNEFLSDSLSTVQLEKLTSVTDNYIERNKEKFADLINFISLKMA